MGTRNLNYEKNRSNLNGTVTQKKFEKRPTPSTQHHRSRCPTFDGSTADKLSIRVRVSTSIFYYSNHDTISITR